MMYERCISGVLAVCKRGAESLGVRMLCWQRVVEHMQVVQGYTDNGSRTYANEIRFAPRRLFA
ncbi:hypothetical protein D3C84_1048430 [compost metagenome]